jgi:hypothetical protein
MAADFIDDLLQPDKALSDAHGNLTKLRQSALG